jgi:hypothetical protein
MSVLARRTSFCHIPPVWAVMVMTDEGGLI